MDAQTLQKVLDLALAERKKLDEHITVIQAEIARTTSPVAQNNSITVREPVTKFLSEPAKANGRPATHASCTVPGCNGRHVARGLCNKHYSEAARAKRRAAREAGRAGPKGLS